MYNMKYGLNTKETKKHDNTSNISLIHYASKTSKRDDSENKMEQRIT